MNIVNLMEQRNEKLLMELCREKRGETKLIFTFLTTRIISRVVIFSYCCDPGALKLQTALKLLLN